MHREWTCSKDQSVAKMIEKLNKADAIATIWGAKPILPDRYINSGKAPNQTIQHHVHWLYNSLILHIYIRFCQFSARKYLIDIPIISLHLKFPSFSRLNTSTIIMQLTVIALLASPLFAFAAPATEPINGGDIVKLQHLLFRLQLQSSNNSSQRPVLDAPLAPSGVGRGRWKVVWLATVPLLLPAALPPAAQAHFPLMRYAVTVSYTNLFHSLIYSMSNWIVWDQLLAMAEATSSASTRAERLLLMSASLLLSVFLFPSKSNSMHSLAVCY